MGHFSDAVQLLLVMLMCGMHGELWSGRFASVSLTVGPGESLAVETSSHSRDTV